MIKNITQDDVIYFVITDRFFGRNKQFSAISDTKIHGGTLDGIIDKLDYLLELGITAIWITPVYENIQIFGSAEPYHYYWPANFDKIDQRLLDGSRLPNSTQMSNLGNFVDACEAKGLKVILDMVVNHAGYGAKPNFDSSWFNVGGKDEISMELAGLPDFNHENPEVVDYFISNIQNWITQGKITNIRMDTVKHVHPRFWHYFKTELRGAYPDTFLVGEVLFEGKDDVENLLQYQNYHDFDSIFDFPLCTALRSTLIYDGSLKYWLARPRLNNSEVPGILDDDNPLKGGYRAANQLVTLLDNHDLDKRIISHARSKHTGGGAGLNWAIRVTKLCLGALFTMRGIPQLYYGTEIGMEGWKSGGNDADLRRDFPWELFDANNHPDQHHTTAWEIYNWTRDLIRLRKGNNALKYGTTITLWSDDLVYAFLRIAIDTVAFVIINNGYLPMQSPIQIALNKLVLPQRAIDTVTGLKHWKTGNKLQVQNNTILITVDAKSIEIFCE
jgi:alpha-amylase